MCELAAREGSKEGQPERQTGDAGTPPSELLVFVALRSKTRVYECVNKMTKPTNVKGHH